MILIATSLSLIAIAAGTFLLAKTKNEALGGFFKFVSWFVILVGFLCIVCIGVRGITHCGFGGKDQCGKQECCKTMGGADCMRGKAGCDEMMEGRGHHGAMGKECCMKGKDSNKHCKRDSTMMKD